jgi:hypothetical protein
VDEDACLKQGKTRLTIITRNKCLNRRWCCRRPALLQGDLPRRWRASSALSPTPWLRACFSRDNDDGNPLLDHSTARNHVDHSTYSAQFAQHWPEGLKSPRPLWAHPASANSSQDFGHQMQVCPPWSRPARNDASANPGLCGVEHRYGTAKAWKHGMKTEIVQVTPSAEP